MMCTTKPTPRMTTIWHCNKQFVWKKKKNWLKQYFLSIHMNLTGFFFFWRGGEGGANKFPLKQKKTNCFVLFFILTLNFTCCMLLYNCNAFSLLNSSPSLSPRIDPSQWNRKLLVEISLNSLGFSSWMKGLSISIKAQARSMSSLKI